VIPGSPAALNQLKPGDVILTVNNEDIRNAEEFTWLLQEAGPGNDVKFTIARPGQVTAEAFQIKLSESPSPFERRLPMNQSVKMLEPASLMAQGVEGIALKPKAAMRFGANGGLLVVYVQPSSEAFKAGLRPGDVIESIDGEQLLTGSRTALLKHPGTSSTFSVVRNKQKLTVTISTQKHNAE
jgi:serine protease Do